jgi:site-specific DNA-methyltransferase (adenine-specific)
MQPTWQSDCGTISLYWADCLDVLPHLSGVDAVVTDPPYGIGVTRMRLGNGSRVVERSCDWDDSAPDLGFIVAMGVPAVVWGGNHFGLPASRKWLVWDKGTGDNDFADCELAWTNMDGAVRKLFRSWVGRNAKERNDSDRFHPTQKPVAVMEWSISNIRDCAGAILDPYMGSGTTGIACIRKDRRFIGIEKEKKYFDIAVERISAELSRMPLLEGVTKRSSRIASAGC